MTGPGIEPDVDLRVERDVDLDRLASHPRSRAADAVAEALSPAYVVPFLLLHGAGRGNPSLWSALGWWAVALVFLLVIPYAVLTVLVRRGRVSDRHVVRRAERTIPYAVALVSVAVGAAVLWFAGAPAQLRGVVAAVLALLLVVTLVTLRWKISTHTACVVAAVGIVLVDVLPGAGQVEAAAFVGVGLSAILAVGWARVRAGRHSVGQVLAGAAVAAVVAPAAYLLVQ